MVNFCKIDIWLWKFLQLFLYSKVLIFEDYYIDKTIILWGKKVCLVKGFVWIYIQSMQSMQSAERIHRALSKSSSEKSRHAVIKEEPDARTSTLVRLGRGLVNIIFGVVMRCVR